MSKQNLIEQIMKVAFPPLRQISHEEEIKQTRVFLKDCTLPDLVGMHPAPYTESDAFRSVGKACNHEGTWHAYDLNDWPFEVTYIHTKSGRKFKTHVSLADIPEAVGRHKAIVELEKSTKTNHEDVAKRLNCLSSKEICSIFDIDLKKFVMNGLTEQQIRAIRAAFN